MLSALLIAAAAAQGAPTATAELYRGAPLPGKATRYWSVLDTSLESHAQDDNLGGSGFLAGGPGRTILIRFADLRRALGPGRQIAKATLAFKMTGGAAPTLRSVSEVLVPWGEGPLASTAPWLARPDTTGKLPPRHSWSATWKHRRSGERAIGWQQPGARGVGDARPLPEARAIFAGDADLRIEGLEAAVQRAYDSPSERFGFALVFEADVDFASSQATKDRPRLILETVDAPKTQGPDLSVSLIAQSPEFERYDPAPGPVATQDGIEIALPGAPRNAAAPRWPKEGQEMAYTATIRNVGDAPSSGFRYRWVVLERAGSDLELRREIPPGGTVTVTTTLPYRGSSEDHRRAPVSLSISPLEADANPANHSLEIQQASLSLALAVERSAYERIAGATNLVGSKSFEDWAQAQVAALNDVFFALSRFSFARDGALERVRIQRIDVVEDGASAAYSAPLSCDGTVRIEAGFSANTLDADRIFLKRICEAIGLVGWPEKTGTTDLHPGLLGWGDTRNESMVPPQLWMPYDGAYEPLFEAVVFEPTDLLAGTDVAGLNANLGKRGGYRGDYLFRVPTLVFVRARDLLGNPLKRVKLEFFAPGSESAVFTVETGADGATLLPKRETGAGPSFESARGHALKPNPFGRIDPLARNGILRVRASRAGASDWSELKLWQLIDSNERSPIGTVFAELRFNLATGTVERAADLARGRIVTDSAQSLPAQLASLVDGAYARSVPLPTKAGDWVEIDLGRDRVVGEIRLLTRDAPFWNRFEIGVYSTAQSAGEAQRWAYETDFRASLAKRGEPVEGQPGLVGLSYRTDGKRIRYIRITNRSATERAALCGIAVHPLSQPAEPPARPGEQSGRGT